ncbi:SGNH/GDSL hydrolase family protein [Pseudomonas sp. X10]
MELKNFFAQDDEGNLLAEATCYLYQRGTESLATGLVCASGLPLTNPFSSDVAGLIQFAAPNGLYDLRILKGARDYRIRVQCNDVEDTAAAATSAAERAEIARDAAQLSAGIFPSVEAGLAATADGKPFQVLAAADNDYLVLYLNQGGIAVEQTRYPSALAVEAVRGLVQTTPNDMVEASILEICDEESSRLAYLTKQRLETPGFNIRSEDATTLISDDEGAAVLYADDQRILLGGLEIHPTMQPGIFVVDEDNCVLQDLSATATVVSDAPPSPFDDGLLFAPTIATMEGVDSYIYPQCLLPNREQAGEVIATLASTTKPITATGNPLPVNASTFGPDAVLNLRQATQAAHRRFMPLQLLNVPVQSPPVECTILFIGDSIGNRQGGYLLKQYLADVGINATFIGTLRGSADPASAGATTGELGECREGWETGDFTNAITDRVSIIAPGNEAAYLAMTKSQQAPINPFLRAATAEDPADLVRNGRIFDPAFYQSRFGLATPDVVICALGTNDVRDRSEATIFDHVYNNDLIMTNQIRKAWPTARIVRTIPGTALNTKRNDLWGTRYAKAIRAMRKAAADRADSKTIVAPLWAMTNPEAGYSLPSGSAAEDGFLAGDWADPVHPIGASRVALYQAMAPFIAAAALNLF